MPASRLSAALRSLHDSGAQFIVIGGLAAVLNGAPVQTYDIDLLYQQSAENIDRLLAVLVSLDAIFRIQPERRLRPLASHLAGSGLLNLLTNVGPVDLLSTVGRGLTYENLVSHSSEMKVADHVSIKVLDLDTLIALKEELGGEKDLAVLPVLRQTLAESQKNRSR